MGDAAKVNLNTRKAIERCARDLQRAAELHDRLQAHVANLGARLQEVQHRAAGAGASLLEVGAELSRRQGEYAELIASSELLMAEAVATREISDRGPSALPELRERLGSLVERAGSLAEAAREAGFRDLADEAKARHQQLDALLHKLEGAAG